MQTIRNFCVSFSNFVFLRTMSEPEERFSGLDPAFAGKFSVYGFAFWFFFVTLLMDVRLCI